MSLLQVVIAPNREIALSRLLSGTAQFVDDSVLLLPSTLDADDAAALLTRRILAERGRTASISTPISPARRFSSIVRPVATDSAWCEVLIERADAVLKKVALPAELMQSRQRSLVCDLDRVAARGPFVLDVLGRYLHPRDRMRVLATSQRQQSLAEVNLALPGTSVLICMSVGGGALAALTSDPILGELTALALSELKIDRDVEFTGPWEDPIVQRATELELGVRLPSEIEMHWDVDDRVADSISAIEDHVAMRLGLPKR